MDPGNLSLRLPTGSTMSLSLQTKPVKEDALLLPTSALCHSQLHKGPLASWLSVSAPRGLPLALRGPRLPASQCIDPV